MRNVSARFVEKIKTYFPPLGKPVVYEIMFRDIVQLGRATDDSM